MVTVELTFGVPDKVADEVKKKFPNEKDALRVTKANPAFPPYYSVGDPRAKPEEITVDGKNTGLPLLPGLKSPKYLFTKPFPHFSIRRPAIRDYHLVSISYNRL